MFRTDLAVLFCVRKNVTKAKKWNGDDVMAYLFIGMIIGGIIGLTVGSLAVAFRLAEKEITRLKREINSNEKS